jgi:hypothetical protein
MKLQAIEPASAADYLVTAEGLAEVYFESFSGVVETFERAKFRDGYSAQQRTAATGSTTYDDITLGKSFDPEKDVILINWVNGLRDGRQVSFTIRPVKRNTDVEFRGAKAWKLSACRLMKAEYPKADMNAPTDVSMVTLTFSVDIVDFS